MKWEYRLLAKKNGEGIYLNVYEVYYNEDNTPYDYIDSPVRIAAQDLKSLKSTLNKVVEASKKPILWAGKRFPETCVVKYTCLLCGRNTFDKPTPHICGSNLRKRGLKWSVNYL